MKLCLAILFLPRLALCGPAEDAVSLVSAGRYEQAAAKFDEAIRSDPDNHTLHLGQGLALQSLKRYSQAIASMEKAARLGKGAPEPFYSLALLHEAAAHAGPGAPAKPHLRKAKNAWEKVLKLDEDPDRLRAAREHLEKIAELLR